MEQLTEWVVVLVLFAVVAASVAVVMFIADHAGRTRGGHKESRSTGPKAQWKKAA